VSRRRGRPPSLPRSLPGRGTLGPLRAISDYPAGAIAAGPRFIWCLLPHAADCRSPRTAFGCTTHPNQPVDQIVDWLPLFRHRAQHRRQSSPQQWGYLAGLTRYGSLPRLLAKQVCDIAGSLIRRQERDDHLSNSAALASKPVPHLRQREVFPEMCAQFHQRAERNACTVDNMRRSNTNRRRARAWRCRAWRIPSSHVIGFRLWASMG
jgi:hypothetical protein